MRYNWILFFAFTIGMTHAATITVGPYGYNHTSMQAAIDAANPGDTIEVYEGTYRENVEVSKQLILLGIGWPVVNAGGCGSAISLLADGITLEGFVATNAGGGMDAGIKVLSSHNVITGNVARDNGFSGIGLAYNKNNTVTNNVAINNTGGIGLGSSRNNKIVGNEASNNWIGITLLTSSENLIESNNATDNGDDGIYLYSSIKNIVRGNLVQLSGDDGVYLYSSDDSVITGNQICNNTDGIYIEKSKNTTIYLNYLFDNRNHNAYDNGLNSWDNGTIGNYYSDFECNDSDGDMICDLSYEIPGGSSVDWYPIVFQ